MVKIPVYLRDMYDARRNGMEKQFPTIDKVKTGKQIRRLMNSLGLTVTDVQEYMGLATQQAVYHWLNGRSLPSIDNVYALSELFKVPMDQIICGNREYQPEQGSMYYRLKAYAKYLQMCVTVACEGKGREQNCFIIESI